VTEKGLQICIDKSELINNGLPSLELMLVRLRSLCDNDSHVRYMMRHQEPFQVDELGNHVYEFRWSE